VALYDPLFQPGEAVLGSRYDFVVCSETAEHFHDPLAEFERLFGLLRPGGWLGLMTGFLPAAAEDFARWHYIRDPTHVVFYGPQSLAWLSRRFGARLEIPADNVALFRVHDR
jgi:SAM-dependent methyltransferase